METLFQHFQVIIGNTEADSLSGYMLQYPGRLSCSYSSLWDPETSLNQHYYFQESVTSEIFVTAFT
jgi:hypothetical protein